MRKRRRRREKMRWRKRREKEALIGLASLLHLIVFNFKTQFGVIDYQTSKNMTLSFPYLGISREKFTIYY